MSFMRWCLLAAAVASRAEKIIKNDLIVFGRKFATKWYYTLHLDITNRQE